MTDPETEIERTLDALADAYGLDCDGEELFEMALDELERRGLVDRPEE